MNKLLALGLPGLASLILLANPNDIFKDFGKIGIGCTGMSLISLSVGGSKQEREIEKLKSELGTSNNTFLKCQDTVRVFDKKRVEAEQKQEIARQLAEDLRQESAKKLNDLTLSHTKITHQLQSEILELKARLREVSSVATSSVHQTVAETYKESFQKTLGLLDGCKRNYPDLNGFFENLETEVDKIKSWASKEIESYGQMTGVDELLNTGLWIQERIINKTADIRIKGLTKIIKYFSELASDSVCFGEYQNSLQEIIAKAKSQIEGKQLEVREVASEWVKSNEFHKQNYEGEFSELINTGKQAVQIIQELQQRIIDLESKISDYSRPRKFYPATREDLRAANLIIEYMERQGFILDAGMSIYHKHSATTYFQVDRNNAISISELNSHSEQLMRHCKSIAPIQFSNDESGLIKAELKLSIKESIEKSAQFKPPTCRSVVERSSRGFLITGHPGAGKSSAIRAIGQWLGGENAIRLALIPHAQDNQSFDDAGYLVINAKELIYQAIAELKEEINLRSASTKSDHRYLIVAIDELGSIIADSPKGMDVMEIIRQAAVEGRKLNIIVILGNHSQTTTAIEMDSQYRESFVQLWLCGAATHKLNMPNAPQLKQNEIDWIKDNAYPALVSINGKYTTAQHPTHSNYNEYQDKGLPPIGIENWEQNSAVIGGMNIPAKRRKMTK